MEQQKHILVDPQNFFPFNIEPPTPGEIHRVKCDKEGVPLLIQKMVYIHTMMDFEVSFFNGEIVKFSTDFACPSVGIMQRDLTRMQWLQAENAITNYVLANWAPLFAAKTEY